MILSTIKGKVVAGVVSVGLLSGVGAAFAYTDAGAQLKGWYDSQFGKSASAIQTNTENYVKGLAPGLLAEYNNGRTAAANAINGEKNTQQTNVTNAITNAKNTSISEVNSKKSELEAGMAAQFNGIQTFANQLIDNAGTQLHGYVYNQFSTLTTSAGAASIQDMDTQITASKDQAKADLQKAIDDAKGELQGMLDQNTTDTTAAIQQAIDSKINELRTQIAGEVITMINTQKGLIDAEAAKLQTQALSELDDVVNGINK